MMLAPSDQPAASSGAEGCRARTCATTFLRAPPRAAPKQHRLVMLPCPGLKLLGSPTASKRTAPSTMARSLASLEAVTGLAPPSPLSPAPHVPDEAGQGPCVSPPPLSPSPHVPGEGGTVVLRRGDGRVAGGARVEHHGAQPARSRAAHRVHDVPALSHRQRTHKGAAGRSGRRLLQYACSSGASREARQARCLHSLTATCPEGACAPPLACPRKPSPCRAPAPRRTHVSWLPPVRPGSRMMTGASAGSACRRRISSAPGREKSGRESDSVTTAVLRGVRPGLRLCSSLQRVWTHGGGAVLPVQRHGAAVSALHNLPTVLRSSSSSSSSKAATRAAQCDGGRCERQAAHPCPPCAWPQLSRSPPRRTAARGRAPRRWSRLRQQEQEQQGVGWSTAERPALALARPLAAGVAIRSPCSLVRKGAGR